MTLLDIYGQSVRQSTQESAQPTHALISEPASIATEPVWELPIGYALATAAAAWVVQALLMHYALVTGGWAIVWPLNGFVAGLTLGKRRRDWFLILFFVAIATTVHESSVTGHWFTAAIDSAINTVEVLIVLAILPPFEDLQQWLRAPGLMARSTLANCIAAPVVSGLLAAAYYHFIWHTGIWSVFHRWALADALGLASALPLVLALRSPASWSLHPPIAMVRSVLLQGAMTALIFAVFVRPQLSLEFILFPALGLVLFFSSFTASMVAVQMICGIAVYRILHQYGSTGLMKAYAHDVLLLQLFLALIVLTGFSMAVLLAERRVLTARFRSSERQYRLLAECSRDVIVMADLEGVCRFVSPASIEVLGCDPEELQGHLFHQGAHEEDVAQCTSLLHDIRLGLASEGMLTYRTAARDGRSNWLEGSVRATTDEAGDVNGVLITLRDISVHKRLQEQLQEARTQLEHQAAFDALTNVANRRRFDDIFEQEWRRAARDYQPLALLLVDVDNFKNYNDAHGSQAGDECLRIIAQTLSGDARRPGDLVARWGGEEFAVLMPATDLHGACEVASRIRHAVEEMKLPHADQSDEAVTVSIGAAAIIPVPEIASSLLMEDADRALGLAKANGRNRVEFKPGPRVVRATSHTLGFA